MGKLIWIFLFILHGCATANIDADQETRQSRPVIWNAPETAQEQGENAEPQKLRKPLEWERKTVYPSMHLPKNPLPVNSHIAGRHRFRENISVPALKEYKLTRKWDYTSADIAAKSARALNHENMDEYSDKYNPRDMRSYQKFIRHHWSREAKDLTSISH